MSQKLKPTTIGVLSDAKSKTLNFFRYGAILICLVATTSSADEKSELATKPITALEGDFSNSRYKKLSQGAKLSATEKSVLISLESFKKDVATNPDNAKSLLKNFVTDLTGSGSKGKASRAATIFKKNPELLLAILIEVDAAAPEAAKSITDTRSYKRSSVFNEISRLNGTLKKAKQQGNVFTSKNLKSLLTNKDIEKVLTVACDVNSKDRGYAALGVGRVSSFFGSTKGLVGGAISSTDSREVAVKEIDKKIISNNSNKWSNLITNENIPAVNQASSKYCGTMSVMWAAQEAFSIKFPKEEQLNYAKKLASLINKEKGKYSGGSNYPGNITDFLGLNRNIVSMKGKSSSELKKKIVKFLADQAVPHLNSGNHVVVVLDMPGEIEHYVDISAYNKQRNEFLVNNSAGGRSNWYSSEWLTTNMMLSGRVAEAFLIDMNSHKQHAFRTPGESIELIVSPSAIQQCKELNNLKKLVFYDAQGVNKHSKYKLENIAVEWDKNAKVSKKTGLSLVCNINNMDGRVVYAAFAKSSTKFEFVIVNGYRGGFGAEEGEVKITYQNGKSQWMDNKDFNKKLAFNFRKKEKTAGYHNVFKGRQGVFLAFPKKPIRCEVLDTKLVEPTPE